MKYIKGQTPWNKGMTGYTNGGTFMKGQDHPHWQNNPSYSAIHKWIVRNFGRANYCSNDECHKAKRYDWANISGEYKRDINDWRQLCRSCHTKLDMTIEKKIRLKTLWKFAYA